MMAEEPDTRHISKATPQEMPLAGVKVVETATYLSGPIVGMMLVDLGADVLKVEPPKGDPLRRFARPKGPMSAQFASVNRGKRGISLDLTREDHRVVLAEQLRDADIFVCNWRAPVAAKLGLDDESLVAANPRLIRCYLSGFGADGPFSERPAFDSTIQSLSGLAHSQAIDGVPQLVRSYVADKVSPMMAVQGVLSALYQRERTGKGLRVDLSMLDAVSYFNFPDLMCGHTFLDEDPGDMTFRMIAATRPVPALDGYFVVSPVTVAQIRRALDAVGVADRLDELLSIEDAPTMAASVLGAIADVTASWPLEKVLARFKEFDLPASPCIDAKTHLEHPQVVWNDIYSVAEWPGMGPVRTVRYPADFDQVQLRHADRPAPMLGEANDELVPGEGVDVAG